MSKTVTKDRQRSLAVHMNRGIMRFSFVGVGSLRAFVSDVDTIGSFPSRADRPRGPSEGRGVAEGPLGRGHSTSTGAVHAFGDRMAVPERVTCPRLEWLAAGRAAFIRRETVVARRIKPWCRAAFQETAWKGDAEDGGPAALGLAHAQAAAQGLHAAPRPLHARLRRPRQRRGRRISLPLWG